MLEFINWFFTFFASFIDAISRFLVSGTVTLGMLVVCAMLFLLIGRFLIGYWKRKTMEDD